MGLVSTLLENEFGFVLDEISNSNGVSYSFENYTLSISTAWAGRWDEFESYNLYRNEDEIFNLSFQVDSAGREDSEIETKNYSDIEIRDALSDALIKAIRDV